MGFFTVAEESQERRKWVGWRSESVKRQEEDQGRISAGGERNEGGQKGRWQEVPAEVA